MGIHGKNLGDFAHLRNPDVKTHGPHCLEVPLVASLRAVCGVGFNLLGNFD